MPTKWEYKRLIWYEETSEMDDEMLRIMGEDGWEAYDAIKDGESLVHFFKRPI